MYFLSWESDFPLRRTPLTKPTTSSGHSLRRGVPPLLMNTQEIKNKPRGGPKPKVYPPLTLTICLVIGKGVFPLPHSPIMPHPLTKPEKCAPLEETSLPQMCDTWMPSKRGLTSLSNIKECLHSSFLHIFSLKFYYAKFSPILFSLSPILSL